MEHKMYDHKDGVTLRKIEKSDLPCLLKLKQESWWGTHKTPIISSDDQEYWYDNIPDDQLFMVGFKSDTCQEAGETNPTRDVIGVGAYTNIDFLNRKLHISGSLIKKSRTFSSKAFCAGLDFAFEILNMRRVEAEVVEYHVAAQKIEVGILGFSIEGRKRESVYKCGKYYDSLVLGLLREDWKSSIRVNNYGDTCNKNFSHDYFQRIMERIKNH